MEEDLKTLESQDILQSCLVKKMDMGTLIPVHIEFSYWVGDSPENFKLIPTDNPHQYDIYRFREKKIIKKNININNIGKSLSKLKSIPKQDIQLPPNLISNRLSDL